MKIAPRDAESFIAKPQRAVRAVLLYGENAGLAREYADRLAAKIVPDARDTDRIVDIGSAELRKDPARLSDEASQMSMFSAGRRLIRIRDASEGMGALFAAFLKESPGDAFVIVEAAELSAKASLRTAFELAANAAAIACYDDALETLVRFAADELQANGVQFEDGALETLIARVGIDRRLIRSELQKMFLYFSGEFPEPRILSKKLVDEFLGQSGDVDASDIASAAAMGDLKALDRLLKRRRPAEVRRSW
jgi:DNA polymerase III subunit delta